MWRRLKTALLSSWTHRVCWRRLSLMKTAAAGNDVFVQRVPELTAAVCIAVKLHRLVQSTGLPFPAAMYQTLWSRLHPTLVTRWMGLHSPDMAVFNVEMSTARPRRAATPGPTRPGRSLPRAGALGRRLAARTFKNFCKANSWLIKVRYMKWEQLHVSRLQYNNCVYNSNLAYIIIIIITSSFILSWHTQLWQLGLS